MQVFQTTILIKTETGTSIAQGQKHKEAVELNRQNRFCAVNY